MRLHSATAHLGDTNLGGYGKFATHALLAGKLVTLIPRSSAGWNLHAPPNVQAPYGLGYYRSTPRLCSPPRLEHNSGNAMFHRNTMRHLFATGLAVSLFTGCYLDVDQDAVAEEAEAVRESLNDAAEDADRGLRGLIDGVREALNSVETFLDGETLVERPLNFRELYDFLPERLGSFERIDREGGTGGMLGIRVSGAEADYEAADGADLEIGLVDFGAVPWAGSDEAMDWLDAEIFEESNSGWKRTRDYKGYPALEEFSRGFDDATNRGRWQLHYLVAGRFLIAIEADEVTLDEGRELADEIDTEGLADLREKEGEPRSVSL